MKVTAAQLEGWHACGEQVTTFRSEWGESVTLTRAVLLRAAELGLNLDWWTGHALTTEQLAEYRKKRAPIDAESWKKRAALNAEYWKKLAVIVAESRKKLAPIDAEYQKKLAVIVAESRKKLAVIVAEVLALEDGDT